MDEYGDQYGNYSSEEEETDEAADDRLQDAIDLCEKSNNYDHCKEYQFGLYVDIKDSIGKWCVGQIIEVNENGTTARVHYDGWSEKYDEYVQIKSGKIAPFRFCTVGYTGQNFSAYRDFHYNFDLHEKFKKELTEIISKGFEVLETPRKVNQYLRGELYLYIDSMLSLYLNTDRRIFEIYYDFMKLVFKMIIRWMEIFPGELVESYEKSKKYPKLYLVDFKTALAKCKQLYSRFQGIYFFKGAYEMAPYKSKKDNIQIDPVDKVEKDGIIYSFVNLFGSMGGFDAFQFFLTGGQRRGEFSCYEPDERYTVPMQLMYKILQAFSEVIFTLNESKMDEIINCVAKCVKQRSKNPTEHEIQVIEMAARYLKRHYRVSEEFGPSVLNYLKKMIKSSDSKDKKLNTDEDSKEDSTNKSGGRAFSKMMKYTTEMMTRIEGIKNIYEDQDKKNAFADLYFKNIVRFPMSKTDYIIKWLIKNEIMEEIFCDSAHPELIKKWKPLALVLVSKNKLKEEILEVIWKKAIEDHEDFSETKENTETETSSNETSSYLKEVNTEDNIYYDFICDIAKHCSVGTLQFLCKKMDAIQNYHFSINFINFFKRFTINASKNWKDNNVKGSGNILKDTWRWVKPKKEKNEEKEIINTQKLWNVSRDPSVPLEIAKHANSSLAEILTLVSRAEIVQYLAATINCLLTQEDFIKNCRFLLGFLNSIRLDVDDIDFMKLNNSFGGIVSCIINKLQQQIHEMFFIRNISPEHFESALASMSNAHEFLAEYKTTHIEALNCIECIIANTDVQFSNDEIDSLFMIFVDQYKFSENGQDMLFSDIN